MAIEIEKKQTLADAMLFPVGHAQKIIVKKINYVINLIQKYERMVNFFYLQTFILHFT